MKKTKIIGHVGVDSGQLLITDPCYIDAQWKPHEEVTIPEYRSDKLKGQYSYNGCCNATLSDDLGGQLNYDKGHPGIGVALSSGFGDGYYPVEATYEDGIIRQITIKF